MELDELLSIEETTKTIEQLKRDRESGEDKIPPETWKHGGVGQSCGEIYKCSSVISEDRMNCHMIFEVLSKLSFTKF